MATRFVCVDAKQNFLSSEVELAARALWPHGILVTTVDDEACRGASFAQAIEVIE
jgi:hypothetical protein